MTLKNFGRIIKEIKSPLGLFALSLFLNLAILILLVYINCMEKINGKEYRDKLAKEQHNLEKIENDVKQEDYLDLSAMRAGDSFLDPIHLTNVNQVLGKTSIPEEEKSHLVKTYVEMFSQLNHPQYNEEILLAIKKAPNLFRRASGNDKLLRRCISALEEFAKSASPEEKASMRESAKEAFPKYFLPISIVLQ